MSLKLTWDQELSLVNEIKKYGTLFDNKHEDFRNFNKREIIWERISEKIGLPVSDCKTRWTNLRKQYVRKKRVGVEKWECGNNSECNYMELLSFITHADDSEAITEEASPKKKKKKNKKKDNQTNDTSDGPEKKLHETEHTDNTDKSEKKKRKKEHYDKNATDGSEKKKQKKEHAVDSSDEMKDKKRMKKHFTEDNTEDEFDVRHEMTNTDDVASPHKLNSSKLFEPDVELYASSVRGNTSMYNGSMPSRYKSPTHKFFETMADLVENLPADLQAQVRLQVCQIVTEMEIKYQGQNEPEYTDSFY